MMNDETFVRLQGELNQLFPNECPRGVFAKLAERVGRALGRRHSS